MPSPDVRLAFLAEASTILASSLDYEATLARLARLAVPALADMCAVDMLGADGTLRRLATEHVDPGKGERARQFREREGFAPDSPISAVARTGRAQLLEEVSDAHLVAGARSPEHLRLFRDLRITSAVVVPLAARGRALGTLTLLTTARSGRRLGAADLALAQDLAARAALAIDNARLYRETEQRRRQAEELAHVARTLAESLDVTEVSDRIVKAVLPLLEAQSSILRLLQPDGSLLGMAVAGTWAEKYGPGDRLPPGTGMVARAIAERRPVWTPDVLREPNVRLPEDFRRALAAAGHRSVLAVPLQVKGEVIGSLSLSRGSAGPFSESDVMLLQTFADQAALAIRNVQLLAREQAARAAAEAANRAKDEFLAVLSHELRTPLTAMLGWVRMLRGGRLTPEQAARAYETIDRNTRIQVQLIGDLLDVSRIVAGKLELELRVVGLTSIVRRAVEALQAQADAKAVRLFVACDPRAPAVMADAMRAQQILANLVSNAVKFTPSGGRVDVTLEPGGGGARVTVRDTGQGIDPALLPGIFDRFRQADSSATRRHGGLGLGLAIVRHLTHLHGGTVQAHSDGTNRGARFVVELPAARRPAAGAAPGAAPAPPGGAPSLEGLSILAVDDHADSRHFIAAALRQSGAAVVEAASAAEALTALAQGKFDVVVTDLDLPDGDGYQILRQLRALNARNGLDVPAVALSGYAAAPDREAALAAGFRLHVAKPVDPTDLVQTVHRLAAAP